MSNLETGAKSSLLGNVESLRDGSRGPGKVVCFPVSYETFGLCLPVQVLKFSYRGCAEYTCDFYPPTLLFLLMLPSHKLPFCLLFIQGGAVVKNNFLSFNDTEYNPTVGCECT